MSKRFTATIAGATIFLVLINILSKGLGFFREILFASEFGLSESFDLYLISAVLPIVISTVIYYIGQNHFIPLYKRSISSGNHSELLVARNFWFYIISGILLSALLILFKNPLLGFYLGNSYFRHKETIDRIFSLFVLCIPFNSGIAILSAYLLAEFEFKIPGYSQLLLNLLIIISIVSLVGPFLIYSIPIGFLSGTILQFLFLVIFIRRKKKVSLAFRKNFLNFDLKNQRIIIVIVIIEMIAQFYQVIDRWFFESVEKGGIAALNYATTMFSLPVTLISVSFSVVLLPFFSHNLINEGEAVFKKKIISALKVNLLIFVPLSFIFFIFSQDMVTFLLERGKFTHADTLLTDSLLKILSAGFLFLSGYTILNKALFANGKTRVLLVISIISIILKIFLSTVFVDLYKQNGLALSTVIVYAFFFFSCLYVIMHSIKEFLHVILYFLFYLLTASFAFLIAGIFIVLFPAGWFYDIAFILLFIIVYIFSVICVEPYYFLEISPFHNKKNEADETKLVI